MNNGCHGESVDVTVPIDGSLVIPSLTGGNHHPLTGRDPEVKGGIVQYDQLRLLRERPGLRGAKES